jgi:preprotein translocase subunit YajC
MGLVFLLCLATMYFFMQRIVRSPRRKSKER